MRKIMVLLVFLLLITGCQNYEKKARECMIENTYLTEYPNTSNICEISITEDSTITKEMMEKCCNNTECIFTSQTSSIFYDENNYENCLKYN